MTAFISPFIKDRARVRALMPHGDFLEIYCKCSIDECEKRDVKGLYKRARNGEVQEFTGISSPYEEPYAPELIVNTDKEDISQSVELVLSLLYERGIIKVLNDS